MADRPDLAEVAGERTTAATAVAAVEAWIERVMPDTWRAAAASGGAAAVRKVRAPGEYSAWYPLFARSGLVAPGWDLAYGGLGWPKEAVLAAEQVLRRYHLPRLNPLGLNLAAPALFSHGSEEQRRRFLPPIVRAEEIWCQLFSEPGAAATSPACRRGPTGTGTAGSSTARRCGRPGPTGQTTPFSSPVRIPGQPSTTASAF